MFLEGSNLSSNCSLNEKKPRLTSVGIKDRSWVLYSKGIIAFLQNDDEKTAYRDLEVTRRL